MIWRTLRAFAWMLAWVIALGCAVWTFGALHYGSKKAGCRLLGLRPGADLVAHTETQQ